MKNRLFPFQGWRLTFFQAVIFATFLVFSVRLYEFQIRDFEEFNADAEENRISSLPIAASRGSIRDRYDELLAYNVPAYNVIITPAELPLDREAELDVFNRLSPLIDVPPTREIALQQNENLRSIEEIVIEQAGFAPFQPVPVALDVPREVMLQILEERIFMPGVDIDVIGVREYPTGATTAHIIGYLGPIPPDEAEELRELGYNPAFDRIGYEGIESYLENFLGGERGSRQREIDVAGEELAVINEIPPVPGQAVRLTIDYELQREAEQLLQTQLNNRNNPDYYREQGRTQPRGLSTQGVVIAMDPGTGEILSMVSLPTYDNTRFARAIDVEYYLRIVEDPARPLLNTATKGTFPPGSIWKLITAAGVVEEDIIDPATRLVDEGDLIVQNRYAPNDQAASQRFVCWLPEGHGLVNLIQSIAYSCDVYFYQVGGGNPLLSTQVLSQGGLGIDGLFRYATATGIGSVLGVELPFETGGRMPDPDWKRRNYGEAWSTGDTYNAAFGQGYVTTTPLQLIASTASLINGGILHQPTLVREFFDLEGNIVEPFEPHTLRTVNPTTVAPNEPLVLTMLEDMIMNGPSSLACTCERTSNWYDPFRCDPEGYRNVVNISNDPLQIDERLYRIHIPLNYDFTERVCQPVRFSSTSDPYRPAFINDLALEYVREGMLQAVELEPGGTANPASIDDLGIRTAGKTGTAEYCDNIADALGYCVRGQWPSHAWYVGYAPYEDPEIIIIAFIYNGGEGSFMALPIVRDLMRTYFELQLERTGSMTRSGAAPEGIVIPLDSPTGNAP